jgi:hypothetical protein
MMFPLVTHGVSVPFHPGGSKGVYPLTPNLRAERQTTTGAEA